MGCRIGITTNLSQRKREWQERYPRISGWKKLAEYSSKTAAQRAENMLSRDLGCDAEPGGAGPERATWYVYKFNY